MCRRFLFAEVSLLVDSNVLLSASENEAESTARNFARAVIRVVDWMTLERTHRLHLYHRSSFSHRMKLYLGTFCQTWIFVGEHCVDTAPRSVWNCVISSRGTGMGSGLSKLAANVAFAMAI
jgi:hypothetical protein